MKENTILLQPFSLNCRIFILCVALNQHILLTFALFVFFFCVMFRSFYSKVFFSAWLHNINGFRDCEKKKPESLCLIEKAKGPLPCLCVPSLYVPFWRKIKQNYVKERGAKRDQHLRRWNVYWESLCKEKKESVLYIICSLFGRTLNIKPSNIKG